MAIVACIFGWSTGQILLLEGRFRKKDDMILVCYCSDIGMLQQLPVRVADAICCYVAFLLLLLVA